jgi:hypothetical protein
MITTNKFSQVAKVLIESALATAVFAMIAMFGFSTVEPVISNAQAATTTSQFTTKQTITSEISFLTGASNIVLSPSIGGITGGEATGTTNVRVYTNNSTGFTMTIAASGTPAMLGDSQGGSFTNYTPAAGLPDFGFARSGISAKFGFTVSASTTADLAQKFLDNGTVCNTGALDTNGGASCWTFVSSTATSTIVTAAPAPVSGSTSTIFMHTYVPANPNPALPKDTYTATTTLTAVTNP